MSSMKEDKENTKPRERKVDIKSEDRDRQDKVKEKKEVLTKVVVRRLPPTLTKDQLEEHFQPLAEHDYFEFFANDSSLYPNLFSRVYINFKNPDDVLLFRDRFDGYVFIDNKGQEYPAIVEFAPFQKIAKKKTKKKDAKAGTIDEDPEYKKFIESYTADDEKLACSPETLLEEIEAKNRDLLARKTTPLLNFLKNRQRIREEKREERRRRELERKRQRDEERRKWREEEKRKRKEAEKQKKLAEKSQDKDKMKEEPKIKLLKKPEKGEEEPDKSKEKIKKFDKEKRDDKLSSVHGTSTKRSEGEAKEEKGKKADDDSGAREHKERDFDREQERDRRQWEKERQRRQEEDRRRQKERYEKDKLSKRREEDRKEKDQLKDKTKKQENVDATAFQDKSEKTSKDDLIKKDRIRNKDRPAMQLYQPGARIRVRSLQSSDSTEKASSQEDKKQECEVKCSPEKEEE